MPEGPFGFPRLTSAGPLVKDDWEVAKEGVTPEVDVYFHSSEDMRELDDNSVHLSVTSPPYNIGWDYGDFQDDRDYKEYLRMMDSVMSETYRTLTEQGRMCLVIPTLVRDGAEGGMSHLHEFIDLAERSSDDWRIREVIIWNKAAGRAPRYSTFPEPWGVLLNNIHECILVIQKPGRRRARNRPPDELRRASEIEEVPSDLQTDVWRIPVQKSFVEADGERVPTYPEEIPRRLIRLYSYIGDTVLDPFAGAGTTLNTAIEESRNAVGYEVREELAPFMQRNIRGDVDIKQ